MASILKRAEEDPASKDEVVERAKWFYYTKYELAFVYVLSLFFFSNERL